MDEVPEVRTPGFRNTILAQTCHHERGKWPRVGRDLSNIHSKAVAGPPTEPGSFFRERWLQTQVTWAPQKWSHLPENLSTGPQTVPYSQESPGMGLDTPLLPHHSLPHSHGQVVPC